MNEATQRTLTRGVVHTLLVISVVGLYALALHWVYSTHVSPSFYYLGYRYTPPTADATVISLIIAGGTALALPRRLDRPSSIMLWVLYAVTAAPTILMAPYTSYLDNDQGMALSATVGLAFGVVALAQNPRPKPLHLSVSPTSVWILVAIFTIGTYALLWTILGFKFEIVAILDVYDVRADFAAELETVGFLSYLVATQANAVNPWIAAMGVLERRWWLVALTVFGQVILYSTTGYKHVLFAIIAWFVMIAVLRRGQLKTPGLTLLGGAAALVVVAAVIDHLMSSNLATSLFSRRFILTPGMLSSAYVQFFSENPHAHLGYSILRPFVDYPYEQTPPYLVGAMITGGSVIASNANLFADGFANFGWLGVFGAASILLVYLRLIDRAAVGLPITVSAVVVVIPAVALSNASVLTAMLSHGLVVALGLLALTPRPDTTPLTGAATKTEIVGATPHAAPSSRPS